MLGDKVVTGRATKKVCLKAVKCFQQKKSGQNVAFLLPAGYSAEYNAMMNVAMRNVILQQGVDVDDIRMLKATEFTTAGEAVVVAKYLGMHYWQNPAVIILVVRWWHAARAEWLLRHFLRSQGLHKIKNYSIEVIKVGSWDILGMIMEPVAWTKNLWRAKHGFRFKDY